MAYTEQLPPPALRGVAECAWTVVPEPGERASVLPDGCMDLIWTGSDLIVAGPDTVPQGAGRSTGRVAAGIRFAPGALPSLLGVPAHALRDRRVPLADLHPDLARTVIPALGGGEPPLPLLLDLSLRMPGRPPAHDVPSLVTVLAAGPAGLAVGGPTARAATGSGSAHAGRPPGSRPGRPRPTGRGPAHAVRLPGAWSGLGPDPSTAALADALGVTTRTLHRRCLDAFGYGPAVLRRVLRFRRALALLQAGTAPAEAAALAGYADQPHLSREVRAFAGASPGQLVASGANRSTPLPSGSSTTA